MAARLRCVSGFAARAAYIDRMFPFDSGPEPLTPEEFFRCRTTPGYHKAVLWLHISIGLCALLIVEGIVGVNLNVTALGPVAVATFVATLISYGRGFTFWIHEGVLLPGGRSAPRMSSLITRPMKRQMIRDVILPRQDYTIPGQ